MKKAKIISLIGVAILLIYITMEIPSNKNQNNSEQVNLRESINKLSQRVINLENKINLAGQIRHPLDNQSMDVFRKALRDEVGNYVFDINWQRYFYYFTFFDSSSWPKAVTGSGSVDYGGGVTLMTGATNGSKAEVSLNTGGGVTGLFYNTTEKYQRFRVVATFTDTTAQTIYMVRGNLDNGVYFGFKIVNATLYGVSNNGGGEATVLLGAIINGSDSFAFEARFSPKDKIVFYVNNIERGVLTTELPTNDGLVGIGHMKITADSAADRWTTIHYFEFIQERPETKQ
jgi:hypothetical protein